jgi:uncharacterized protein
MKRLSTFAAVLYINLSSTSYAFFGDLGYALQALSAVDLASMGLSEIDSALTNAGYGEPLGVDEYKKAQKFYGENNLKAGLKWAEISATKGNNEAAFLTGYAYENSLGTKKDYKKAKHWYRQGSYRRDGNPKAKYHLGMMYCYGKEIDNWEINTKAKAKVWVQKASNSGYKTATEMLPQLDSVCVDISNKPVEVQHIKLENTDSNPKEEIRRVISNIETGPSDTVEQYNLAYQYATGEGKLQNYKKAYEWFLKSAAQGNAGAENWIGVLLNNGDGVKQDEKLANYWFERSADNGDAYGQYNIADRYYWGTGVNKDYTKAAKYLKKSAAQDHIEAQIKLGEMYESGQGVLKNYKAAGKLYKKAAEQDNPEAYIKLANLMLIAIDEGVVIPEDTEEKRKYYKKIAKAVNKAFNLSDEGSEVNNTAKEMWDKYELWKYPY